MSGRKVYWTANCCFERDLRSPTREACILYKKCSFYSQTAAITQWHHMNILFVCIQMQYFFRSPFGLGQEWTRKRLWLIIQLEKLYTSHARENPWLCVLPNPLRANNPFSLSRNSLNNKQISPQSYATYLTPTSHQSNFTTPATITYPTNSHYANAIWGLHSRFCTAGLICALLAKCKDNKHPRSRQWGCAARYEFIMASSPDNAVMTARGHEACTPDYYNIIKSMMRSILRGARTMRAGRGSY